MEANRSNLYNLLLQRDYEGKYTGWKQGLIFDGFQDDSKIESITDNMVRSTAAKFLFLNAKTSETEDINFGTTFKTTLAPGESLSETWTCDRMGITTALRLYMTGQGTLVITDSLGAELARETKGGYDNTVDEIAFPWSVRLVPGETYTFRYTAATQSLLYRSGDGQFGYRVMVSAIPQEGNGVLVTTSQSLGIKGDGLMVWLRHSVCIGVTVSVLQGDSWISIPFVKSTMSYTLNGESCVQRQFTLNPLPSTLTAVSLRIEIQPIPLVPVQLYDYGAAIL